MTDLSSPILDYAAPEDLNPTQDEKNIALLCHVLTLVAWFVAPLVIFLIKKDESEYIRSHAAESLNFQLSIFLYMLLCIPLVFIVVESLWLLPWLFCFGGCNYSYRQGK